MLTVYSFGDVTVDEAAFLARRGTRPLDLEPKTLELLLLLLSRRGRLVTKAEIQAALWPDAAVTESALTRLVAQLRKALDDDARDARYVETVPTRGYRFIAPVQVGPVSPPAATPAVAPAPATVPESAPPTGPRGMRMVVVAGALVTLAALAIAALSGGRSRLARREDGRRAAPVMLSATPGINAFPSFSADGASLAFASDRTGRFEIYVRGLEPNARETSVTSDGQQNIQPAWSPDGRSIAYVSMGRGGIWVVPSLGGAPRQLSAFGARPSWSPDSSTIVFQSQSPLHPIQCAATSGSELWTVAATGGPPRPLTHRSGWGHGSPVFSPDGRRIAYTAELSVWTIRPDGTDARPLQGIGSEVDAVFWSRDGRDVFAALRPLAAGGAGGRILRLPVSASGDAAGPPLEVAIGGPDRSQFALAPDGVHVAYVESSARFGIDVVALRTDGTPASAPRPLLPQLTLRATAPVFSPDGRRIAFLAFRPGGGWGLWIADADGTRAETVRHGAVARSYLSWLADGRIAFGEPDPQHDLRLLAWDPATGHEEVLLDPGFPVVGARVSPDGAHAAFMRAERPDETYQIWAADLPRGAPRRLTDGAEGAGWPVWSPDGKTLAFEAMRGGNTTLDLISAAGGAPRPLATRPSHNWPSGFSSDGRRVVYAAQRGGVWNVCLAALEDGAERCVTSYTRFDGYVRTPALSPQGDRVVFERSEAEARLWVGTMP